MTAPLSRYQAAEYLGVSVDTLDRLRAAGRLSACQVSARLIKYLKADLDGYLIACQTTPSSRSEQAPTGTSSGMKAVDRIALQRARQIVARQKPSSRRYA